MVKTYKENFERYFIVIPIITLIFIVMLYIYFLLPTLEKNLSKEIQTMFVQEVSYFLQNVEDHIKHDIDNKSILDIFFKNESLRKKYEDELSLLLSPNIKYVYMLYLDKDGKFRYLLDASKEDKARPHQKFDVLDDDWYKVVKTKKDLIIKEDQIDSIWITYLKPLVNHNKLEAILVVDFSVKKLQEINGLIANIKLIVVAVLVFIGLAFNFILYQIIKYGRLKKKTYIDTLTQAYNRVFLSEMAAKLRLDNFAILAIDVDHFKMVNDTYGHEAGDKVLKEIARRIKSSIREAEDLFIRYGGEEFLLLIRKSGDRKKMEQFIERLRKIIGENPIKINDKENIKVTVSIGVNFDTDKAKGLDEAIKIADHMLYEAKRKGRDRVEIYNENIKIQNTDISLNDVKDALLEKRIISYYQPVFDLHKMKPIRYEVLARMKDRQGNIVPPNVFLDIIRGTNIYFDFTKYILESNIDMLKENHTISISINLSILDILNNDIINLIKEKVSPDIANRISFEVLESEEIENYQLIAKRLEIIKQTGAQIAIDDFGSGYSNFVHIANLNLDALKIDGSLIRNIDKDETSYKIVKTIKLFCDEINIEAVAEFVSSEKIFKKVKEIGIPYGQGFYLAKPMSFEEMLSFNKKFG